MHFNGLEEFYFPGHCSLIKETLKIRKKVVYLDINRPHWLDCIWTVICFSLFWPYSSRLDFKRHNGFKVLTFDLYWATSRTHSAIPIAGIYTLLFLYGSLDINTFKKELALYTLSHCFLSNPSCWSTETKQNCLNTYRLLCMPLHVFLRSQTHLQNIFFAISFSQSSLRLCLATPRRAMAKLH